nr:cell wall-binding repeat-containing protein [Jeotgalibacillus malaysiensis]
MKKTIFAALFVLVISSFFSVNQSQAETFDINRIYGEDRYATAVEVSKKSFPKGSDAVVIAVGTNFPDALAGTPLAHKLNAPIILSTPDRLSPSAYYEIKRLNPSKAIVLGGHPVINSFVDRQLGGLGIEVERISGNNRYETAANIADRIGGSKAVVASGASFADSLAIASYAAEQQIPILLTPPDELHPSVKAALQGKSSTYVVGGTAAVSDTVVNQLPAPQRIAGKDRYETATKVIETFYPSSLETATVATGQAFADALTGSTYAANKSQPVVLTRQNSMPSTVKKTLNDKSVDNITVIGGEQVIPTSSINPPPPAPKPVVQTKPDVASEIVTTAKKYIGTPYKWGGTTPAGFDCSGFLGYVFRENGLSLPRTTIDIWNQGTKVSTKKVGDIVMFSTYRAGASHAGIYIGNNQFIHSGNNGVEITSLSNSYWSKAYIGTVRYIK